MNSKFFFFLVDNYAAFCDSPVPWQMGPQQPATPVMEGMIFFHNYLMFFMILIGIAVFFILGTNIVEFSHTKSESGPQSNFTHSSLLEIIWTILPAVVLLLIAVPSFTLLYSLDELVDPTITLKVIGHQWYWSYEYSDTSVSADGWENFGYDSYMIPTADIPEDSAGWLRLLEVDNRVVLPVRTHIRLLVTASDVIHSWAVPSFGLKIDGTPGRLTQASLYIKRQGTFYGQCSEICGVNHAFMPIVVVALDQQTWGNWITTRVAEQRASRGLVN